MMIFGPIRGFKMTRTTKKVVLIIVEGETDRITLNVPLKLANLESDSVRFEVFKGDVFANNKTNANIEKAIENCIENFTRKTKITVNDIKEVIHICDIDAVFIEETNVGVAQNPPETMNGTSVKYEICHESLLCDTDETKTRIIERNKFKSARLKKIFSVKNVKDLPYSLYYFSMDIDHFFLDRLHLSNQDKVESAYKLEQSFSEDEFLFAKLIEEINLESIDDFSESWNHIFKHENAFIRFTNINIMLARLRNESHKVD